MDTTTTIPKIATVDRVRILKQFERKLLWLSAWMIHNANHIGPNRDGLKVGGHQASCASIISIMAALYLEWPGRGPHRGEASCRSGIPCDQLPVRPADVEKM